MDAIGVDDLVTYIAGSWAAVILAVQSEDHYLPLGWIATTGDISVSGNDVKCKYVNVFAGKFTMTRLKFDWSVMLFDTQCEPTFVLKAFLQHPLSRQPSGAHRACAQRREEGPVYRQDASSYSASGQGWEPALHEESRCLWCRLLQLLTQAHTE